MLCSSLPPWFVLRDAVGGDLPGQKLCVLHAQVRSLLRHIHVWGSVAFLLFPGYQDFVSPLCRLGGQSSYLSGQFWFILCSDMLPYCTPTWGISTRHTEG